MKTNNYWVVLGVVVGWGCGGPTQEPPMDTTPPPATQEQPAAVAAAAGNNCDTYASCGAIGTGKAFATRDACLASRKDFWNERWPMADCEGRINQAQLTTCLEALRTIACNNLIDELKTINTRCPMSTVCSGQ